MAIATLFELTFACGHVGDIDLSDVAADRRAGRLSYLREKGVCNDCFAATRDKRRELARAQWVTEQRQAEAAEATTWAQTEGYPPLSGSDKQTSYAVSLRHRWMRDLHAWAVEDGNDPAGYERVEPVARRVDQARWWLDQKELITEPSDLIELLTAADQAHDGETCENPH